MYELLKASNDMDSVPVKLSLDLERELLGREFAEAAFALHEQDAATVAKQRKIGLSKRPRRPLAH